MENWPLRAVRELGTNRWKMERHTPIDETYCPFPRVVSLQNVSVVLFGDDSEESEILY